MIRKRTDKKPEDLVPAWEKSLQVTIFLYHHPFPRKHKYRPIMNEHSPYGEQYKETGLHCTSLALSVTTRSPHCYIGMHVPETSCENSTKAWNRLREAQVSEFNYNMKWNPLNISGYSGSVTDCILYSNFSPLVIWARTFSSLPWIQSPHLLPKIITQRCSIQNPPTYTRVTFHDLIYLGHRQESESKQERLVEG